MKNYQNNARKSSSGLLRKRLLIGLVSFVVLVGGLALLDGRNVIDLPLFKDKATSGTIPSTPTEEKADTPENNEKSDGEPSSQPSGETTKPSEGPKEGDSATNPTPSGAAPITPYGNFVSNHHPNLDGNPAPSSVLSVCNTTPGATCYITFTNPDGVVKDLAAQKTDSTGSTSWSWDVKSAGFTVGSWKIKVYATQNGKTTTADDAQNLEVGP